MKKRKKLTLQQKEASKKIEDWFFNSKDQLFVLAGYAGTGKSFLIQEMANKLNLSEDEVIFVAPTGKAVEVLISRGLKNVMTLYKLIYFIKEEKIKKIVNEKETEVVKLNFVKRESLENSYKLIIIDEFSMVSEEILNDIKSFGIKILASGDNFQLPPIGGVNKFLLEPDFLLSEVVRQSAGNPIIQLATDVRNGARINPNNYDKTKILFLEKERLTESQIKLLFLKSDQIIVGKNTTKDEINNTVRKFNNVDTEKEKLPLKGEKVISLVNDWTIFLDKEKKFNLANGTIGIVSENSKNKNKDFGLIKIKPNYECELNNKEILFDCGNFKNGKFSYELHEKALVFDDETYETKNLTRKREKNESIEDFSKRIKKFLSASDEVQINRFDFAYAITAHKSQGSEWKKVLIFDESDVFQREKEKWLYTCITRAKEKLVVIY